MSIPHESIRQREDRSWSFRLIDALLTCDEQESEEVVRTLETLDDPRIQAPLIQIMSDLSLNENIRERASEVLIRCSSYENEFRRREWWESGDRILMRFAVVTAERTETELIESIASDPMHPYYEESIYKLEFAWEEPRFQRLKVEALKHPSSDVRYAAAEVLHWDQPVISEDALLTAAREDEVRVADMAADTLRYYCSQKVLIALDALRKDGRAELKDRYEDSFFEVHERFIDRVPSELLQNSSQFQAWIAPVRHLLNFPADADERTFREHQPGVDRVNYWLSADEIIEDLGDPDGEWSSKKDRWYAFRWWHGFSVNEQDQLSDFFVNHFDSFVREHSAFVLANWLRTKHLLQLASDSDFGVRKSAVYNLRVLPKNTNIGNMLWDLLFDAKTCGTHARETFESFVKHAPLEGLNQKLVGLAINDERESVCRAAISELCKRKACDELRTLLPLLERDPQITWSVHASLVDACGGFKFEIPYLAKLQEVDDLYLQMSLAEAMMAK